MLVNLVYYMLGSDLYAFHMLVPYYDLFWVLTSRSPLLKNKFTLSFYLIIKHFLCCSLHFFQDVCITKYKQGVKGGKSSVLTCFLFEYWKYNLIDGFFFLIIKKVIFCKSFSLLEYISISIYIYIYLHQCSSSYSEAFLSMSNLCLLYDVCIGVYIFDIFVKTVGSLANSIITSTINQIELI